MQAVNLTQNLTIVAKIIETVAVFLGWLLFFVSIYKFKRYGEMRTMMSMHMNIMGPVSVLVASALLLLFPQFVSTLVVTVWGVGNQNPLPYRGPTDDWGMFIKPVLMFLRILGIISIIRGVILLSRLGESQSQPGQGGKAAMHLVGGLLSVHIMYTIELLKNIFGLV